MSSTLQPLMALVALIIAIWTSMAAHAQAMKPDIEPQIERELSCIPCGWLKPPADNRPDESSTPT